MFGYLRTILLELKLKISPIIYYLKTEKKENVLFLCLLTLEP